MKTKLFLLTTAAALSCSLATLPAEDAPKPPPPPPGGAPQGQGGDRGQRGTAALDELLKRMDTNGDGKISKEEFLEYSKKEAEDRFAKMDTNGDGFVDKAELEEGARKAREARGGGERMRRGENGGPTGSGGDSNGFRPRPSGTPDGAPPPPGSGSNTPPGGAPPPGGDGGGRRGGFGRGGGGAGGGGSVFGELFRKVQENGSVTKEEFQKMSDDQFKRFDTNGDGKITKEELDEVLRSMRGGQGGGQGGPGGNGGGFRRPAGPDGNGGGNPPPPPGNNN